MEPLERLAASLAQAILSSPTLQVLKTLQRRLDALDIEGLHKFYNSVHHTGLQVSENMDEAYQGLSSPEPTLEVWTTFVDRYLSDSFSPTEETVTVQHLEYYTLAYLLSATFKDCSIIVRFAPNSSNTHLFAIDLDPKPLKHLKKWYDLDQKIVRSFKQRIEKEGVFRCCIGD